MVMYRMVGSASGIKVGIVNFDLDLESAARRVCAHIGQSFTFIRQSGRETDREV